MKCGQPFLVKGTTNYYFHFYDGDTRKKISTGTSDYKEAVFFIERYQRQISQPAIPSLYQELQKYQHQETNPRYRRAQIEGTKYSDSYAYKVANHSKHVEEILEKGCPALLGYKLNEITRRDANYMLELIVKAKGRCRTAVSYQQILKCLFSEAMQDGIIDRSPFFQQKVINYEELVKESIPNEWLAWLISREDLFPSHEFWAFVTILVGTGMRKSEAIALSSFQLKDDILIINRAMKSRGIEGKIETPKCDIVRTVVLSKLVREALNSLPLGPDGRYFYRGESWIYENMTELKGALRFADAEHRNLWENMTPHILRCSFNTNCIVAGCNPMLVGEYCGWQHQGNVSDVQLRYTKFRAKHLQCVANCVDDIYTYKEMMLEAL